MKNQIAILTLLLLNLFQPIFSMAEIQEKGQFSQFNDLPRELQFLILIELPALEAFNCPTTFDKITESYKSIKNLLLVCKAFKSLESSLMDAYKSQLKKIFSKFSKEEDIPFFDYLVVKPTFEYVQDTEQPKLTSEYDYEQILHWMCKKPSTKIFKSVLIILRLRSIDVSEKNALKDIFSKFEGSPPPLHLASKYGNVELAEYLTNLIISKYFNIDINAEYEGKTPLLMCSTSQKRCCRMTIEEKAQFEAKLRKIIQLLLKAGANQKDISNIDITCFEC